MYNKKYNYFYKITNNINNHYYYGIHSTDNLEDGYMGSGVRLRKAYKKYGVENFTKEILKFFDTRKEASDYECEIVTEELVKENDCYNSVIGGEWYDKCGQIIAFNINKNEYECVEREYYHKHKEEYYFANKGKVLIKDENAEKGFTYIDVEKYKKLKLIGKQPDTFGSKMVSVKDKNNNYYSVSVNDKRYLNGELVPTWKGRKHKRESIEKAKETFKKNKHQQGDKNSRYGTCWVYNEKTNENKSISKEELDKYIQKGFKRGRKLNLENDKVSVLNKEEIIKLRKEGKKWIEIYKILDVSESTMYKFRKRNNLETI